MSFDMNNFEREVERFRYSLVHSSSWDERISKIEAYNKKIHETIERLKTDESEQFALMRCAYVASGIASLSSFFYSLNDKKSAFSVLYDNYSNLISSVKFGEIPKEKALAEMGSSLFVANEINIDKLNTLFENQGTTFDKILEKVPDIKQASDAFSKLIVSVVDAKNSGYRPHKMHEYGEIVMKNLDDGKLENYRDELKELSNDEKLYYVQYLAWVFKSGVVFKKAKEAIETGKGNFAYSAMFDGNEMVPYIYHYMFEIMNVDTLENFRNIFEVPRPEVRESQEAQVDVKDILKNVFEKGQSK